MMLLAGLLFFGFFGIAAYRSGEGALWFRSLVPAWRFFDFLEDRPVVWCRYSGVWRCMKEDSIPNAGMLFLNPTGNLNLNQESLLALHLKNPKEPILEGMLEDLRIRTGAEEVRIGFRGDAPT